MVILKKKDIENKNVPKQDAEENKFLLFVSLELQKIEQREQNRMNFKEKIAKGFPGLQK